MAGVREHLNMKFAQLEIEGKTIEEGLNHPTKEEAVKWPTTLKVEIILLGQYDIGVSEIKKDYVKNHADEIFERLTLLSNIYYIDKIEDKEKMYVYDANADIIYNIPKTRIWKYVVHSVNELDRLSGVVEEYELINDQSTLVTVAGISHYEPNLSGFDMATTSVVYYEVGENVEKSITIPAKEYISGGKKRTITKDGITYEFYNYNTQKWANILVEKNGIKSWWVWIPRYCYKETDVSDVKFIDLNTTPESGYILHSDFADGKKGIWVSKYEPVNTVKTTVLDIPYYLPDMTGFNKENTYIEVYNSEEEKFEETKLSTISNLTEFAKKNKWFDYNKQIWANIKVINPESNTGEIESWWVWIPRYAYNINGSEIGIIFVDTYNKPLDGSTLPENYMVHPGFTIKEGDNTKELKGMWVSKYEPIQKVETTAQVNPPNMKGYNADNTYIECYDSESNSFKEQTLRSVLSNSAVIDSNNIVQKSEIDFSKINGTWYSYDKQIWANIKVVNPESNSESWWVWIPRYAYNIVGNQTIIVYLDKNGNTLDGSPLLTCYVPHPAFNESPEGIWASKYEAIQK